MKAKEDDEEDDDDEEDHDDQNPLSTINIHSQQMHFIQHNFL